MKKGLVFGALIWIFVLALAAFNAAQAYTFDFETRTGQNIVVWNVNSNWQIIDDGNYTDTKPLRLLTIMRNIYQVQSIKIRQEYYRNGQYEWYWDSPIYWPGGYTWEYLAIPNLNLAVPRAGDWEVVTSVSIDEGPFVKWHEQSVYVANAEGRQFFNASPARGLFTSLGMKTSSLYPYDYVPHKKRSTFTEKQVIFVSLVCGDIGINSDYTVVFRLYYNGIELDKKEVWVFDSIFKERIAPWAQFNRQERSGKHVIKAFMAKDGKETFIREVSFTIK